MLPVDAALEYLDQNLSVIPVGRDKRPLFAWGQFQSRRPSREEVEAWWQRWPTANVAIICGAISGIWVLDADGPEGQRWLDEHAPRTAIYSRTAKGVHAIYRMPPGARVPNAVRLAPEVDVRGDGGYIVAPPSVHESGHVYEWVFLEGFCGWDGLTEWLPPGNNGEGNLGVNLEGVKSSPVNEPVAQGSRNQTLASLAGKWFRMGLAAEEVAVLARSWNAKNTPPLGETELTRTLASIEKKHSQNDPVVEVVESVEPEAVQAPEDEVFPDVVLKPGGLLQEIMDYTEASTPTHFPLFALGGAVCLLGTLAGQKVQTETGLRTNFYVITLAYSGSGKDGPLAACSHLLGHAGAEALLGPSCLTSEAAILRALVGQPVSLYLLDEIGDILQGLKSEKSVGQAIPGTLKRLFSGTGRSEAKTYADGRNNIHVSWHHLSMYAVGSPDKFWESLNHGDVTDGFLGRTLILQSGHAGDPPRENIDAVPPQDLVDGLSRLFQHQRPRMGGTMSTRPDPVIVPLSRDAKAIMAAFTEEYHELKNQYRKEADGRGAIYGRAAEHARKLALIRAVSSQGEAIFEGGQVQPEDVAWAIAFVEPVVRGMVRRAISEITVNALDRWHHKICRAIEAVATPKRPGASPRDISWRVRGLRGKELDECLMDMERSGRLVRFDHKPARGPSTQLFGFPKSAPGRDAARDGFSEDIDEQ